MSLIIPLKKLLAPEDKDGDSKMILKVKEAIRGKLGEFHVKEAELKILNMATFLDTRWF